jgi:hypothetical protein
MTTPPTLIQPANGAEYNQLSDIRQWQESNYNKLSPAPSAVAPPATVADYIKDADTNKLHWLLISDPPEMGSWLLVLPATPDNIKLAKGLTANPAPGVIY